MSNLTEAQAITTDEGAVWEPWTNGYAVGFKVTLPDASEHYVYLNPSSGNGEGRPDTDAFVYIGDTGNPDHDDPQHYYDLGWA